MESHKKSKYKEKTIFDDNIDDLIEKKEFELLAHKQKIEEIKKKLFLLNITEDNESENFIKKADGS